MYTLYNSYISESSVFVNKVPHAVLLVFHQETWKIVCSAK